MAAHHASSEVGRHWVRPNPAIGRIQPRHLRHVLLIEFEIVNIKVFDNSVWRDGLWNDHEIVLNVPTDNRLSRGFAVLAGDSLNRRIRKHLSLTERAPRLRLNVALLMKLPHGLLLKPGVQLNLVD